MAGRYLEILFTPAVKAAQQHYYGREQSVPPQPALDPLGPDETAFIQARDSFYLASLSPSGWPYVQHRGGEPGFLQVMGPHRLAFADYKGNRQMLTTGHVAVDDRVSLFLMDYPGRQRLKILGRLQVLDAREHADFADALTNAKTRAATERVCVIDVVSFDWNCPKYIAPRYTAAEVEETTQPLRARIAELEQALSAVRAPE